MRVCLRILLRQRVLGAVALLLAIGWALFSFATMEQGKAAAPSVEPLRAYAERAHIWFGTTLQGNFFDNRKYVQLLETHFNSGVSMTLLPFTQPEPGSYDLHAIDRLVEFAHQHNLKLFGVNLVYRSGEGPAWFYPSCKTWSKEKMDSFLKDRIQTLVHRGGDTYYGWEVVNEPITPTHNGCWSKVLGDYDYIAKAFRYAHEANPKAELMLNDGFGHDGFDKNIAKEFFDIIRKLKADKVPIDVAGTETHLQPEHLRPTYVEEFKWFLDQARELGVQVQVTEMDVKLPPGSGPDMLQKQKEIFYNILHTCLKDSNCTGFTMWGLADGLRRRKDTDPPEDVFWQQKPSIFDENLEPKPAFAGILQALKEGR